MCILGGMAHVVAAGKLRRAVSEEASAGLQTSAGVAAAARRLDAEDPTMRQVLAWAVGHDLAVAVRLAVALCWWWWLGGRLPGQYALLSEVAGRAGPGSDGWCAVQRWLGMAAMMSADLPRAVGHFTAARDALQHRGPSRLLAEVLEGRATVLLNAGQLAEGTEEGRRALAMARDLGDPAAEVLALVTLGIAALYSGDNDGAVELIRRQQQITGGVPAVYHAGSTVLVTALIGAGDLAAAESACAAALARCRDAGDMTKLASLLSLTAELDVRAAVSRRPPRTCAKGSRSCCGPAICGRPATGCGPAGGCAPRPGATPKPPRCGPPVPFTTGSRGSSARRPKRRAEGGSAGQDPARAGAGPGPARLRSAARR